MNPDSLRRLRDLFDHVQEMSLLEREHFLEHELGGQPEIREHLERLLEAQQDSGDLRRFIENP